MLGKKTKNKQSVLSFVDVISKRKIEIISLFFLTLLVLATFVYANNGPTLQLEFDTSSDWNDTDTTRTFNIIYNDKNHLRLATGETSGTWASNEIELYPGSTFHTLVTDPQINQTDMGTIIVNIELLRNGNVIGSQEIDITDPDTVDDVDKILEGNHSREDVLDELHTIENPDNIRMDIDIESDHTRDDIYDEETVTLEYLEILGTQASCEAYIKNVTVETTGYEHVFDNTYFDRIDEPNNCGYTDNTTVWNFEDAAEHDDICGPDGIYDSTLSINRTKSVAGDYSFEIITKTFDDFYVCDDGDPHASCDPNDPKYPYCEDDETLIDCVEYGNTGVYYEKVVGCDTNEVCVDGECLLDVCAYDIEVTGPHNVGDRIRAYLEC